MGVAAGSRLVDELRGVVGEEHVLLDGAERAFHSSDLSASQRELAAAVVRPGSTDEVAGVVRAAVAAGAPVVPRGGGVSYTNGYAPARPGSVLVDLRRLAAIEVHADDLYVVVGAGATWESVYMAAAAEGVRVPYWGPASGRWSVVGGALSQGSLFWGAARHGYSGDQVLGLEVVLGDGTVLRTGSWAHRNGTPFTRYYGPDLTGLFLNDTGAMGIKARASLKLIPLPACTGATALAFDRTEDFLAAYAAVLRLRVASECFGFDAGFNEVLAGRGFAYLQGVGWTLNATAEGPVDAIVDAALARIEEEAVRCGGRRIDASLPLAMRADPYGHVETGLATSEGALSLFVHAIVPLSRSAALVERCRAWEEEHRAALDAHGIRAVHHASAAGTDFLYEIVLSFPDALDDVRLRRFEEIGRADLSARWRGNPPRPEAREVAVRLRQEYANALTASGAVHMQIGKFYDYRGSLEPATYAVLEAVKGALDPHGLVNPGSLGLDLQGGS